MTRVLVLGAGQLAQALKERADAQAVELVVAGRAVCDLRSGDDLAALLDRVRPDILVNAAAYTKVDLAERELEIAFETNGEAAGLVAQASHVREVPFIHISTDYVFDGKKGAAYVESDPVNPLGVYARSKELGEQRVRASAERHLIVRTAWLYAPYGANFVRTMIEKADQGHALRVVDDQIGSPTSALSLADAVLHAAQRLPAAGNGCWGTYHFADAGSASWYDLAKEIFRQRREYFGLAEPDVQPVSTDEYPTASPRPPFSALNCARFSETFDYRCRDWKRALEEVIRRLSPVAGEAEAS